MKISKIVLGLSLALSLSFPVYGKTISATLTAYCACTKCCGKQAKGLTASGTKVVLGVIAVDPKVIPLGSLVWIGGKMYKAMDTGSAIKGNRVDVYVVRHSDAVKFGVKKNVLVSFNSK